ncbi:unnamed protein product [Cladocopium goreaui]|uniref:Uncharacterized protein n=1 Tax=Cladocopium goreaui TaxID=2562237 RepID=A0A9P1BG98_9DINO|nr:unnamed protein product [Cladocopium goreaui]
MPDVAPLCSLGSRATAPKQGAPPRLPEVHPDSRWQYCAKQRKIREAPKIAARKKLLQSFSARLGTGASVVHSRSAGNLSPIREATSITPRGFSSPVKGADFHWKNTMGCLPFACL